MMQERLTEKTDQDTINILKERARALSIEFVEKESSQDKINVVEFLVENERYGIEDVYIQNVQSIENLCYLPRLPQYFLGIINVHGVIISVIDVAKFFEIKSKASINKKIIILKHENVILGLCVDDIVGVVEINTDTIHADISSMLGIRKEYLKGITLNQMALIDAVKLCTDKKIVVNQM